MAVQNKGGVTVWGKKKNPFAELKINSCNRYFICPIPIILYLMTAETVFSNQDMAVYYVEIESLWQGPFSLQTHTFNTYFASFYTSKRNNT